MTEEAVAAPAAPEPAGASIEQPVTPPQPIESTGPERPEQPEQPEKPAKAEEPERDAKKRTVRDALKDADKTARAKAEKDTTPEPDKAKAEPDKGVEPEKPEGRTRDETGKFVSKDAAKPTEQAPEGQKQTQQQPAAPDPSKPFHEPPARFKSDQAASSEWANAPESVRAATHRVVRELEQGVEKYREDATKFDEVRDLDAHVRKHGSNIKDALTMYLTAEHVLRTNPDAGLRELFKNLGLNPTEWASRFLNQEPDQKRIQDERTINELRNEINGLKQQIGGVTQSMQSQQKTTVERSIAEFAEQNPRFDELADEIAEMLETGYAKNLQDAYDKADRLNPAPAQAQQTIAPAQTRTPAQTAEAQTLIDKGGKSISGAPSGEEPPSRRPSSSIRESLRRAAAAAT